MFCSVIFTKIRQGLSKTYGKKFWTQVCWNQSQYVVGLSNNEGSQENRYRMEWTNIYTRIDNVTMHVIEHDIALALVLCSNIRRREN